jgi:hypothetical protein
VIRRLLARFWAWAAARRDAQVTAALEEPEELRPWDRDLAQLLRESLD